MQSSGIVLEKVCEYFYYFVKHKEAKDVADMDFPIELSLELLMAADYLDSTSMPQTLSAVYVGGANARQYENESSLVFREDLANDYSDLQSIRPLAPSTSTVSICSLEYHGPTPAS
jgi:hypothetical protein